MSVILQTISKRSIYICYEINDASSADQEESIFDIGFSSINA